MVASDLVVEKFGSKMLSILYLYVGRSVHGGLEFLSF